MDQETKNALEILEKLSADPPMITYYFHYDPSNGIIKNINLNLETNEFPYIEISQNEVDVTNEYITEYQIIERDSKPTLVKKEIRNISKVDDNIHQIPKRLADPDKKISQLNYYFDLLIEQDNFKKEFRIRVSGSIKDQYRESLYSKQHFLFYVTAENDPNILYKTLDIPLAKLLQYHYYTISYEDYDGTPCNTFCMRYFYNYLHLVIND